MMLFFEPLSEPLRLSDEYVFSLIIEKQKLFYRVVYDLYSQKQKFDGNIILSENGKIMDVSKNVELLSQFIPFEINQKTLVTKLHKKLSEFSNEQLYTETQNAISAMNKYLLDLVDCYDSNLEMNEISIAEILKMYNVRFSENSDSLVMNIYDYCKNVIALDGSKLFIFVNLRNYIDDDEFDSLVKTMVDHKMMALFIESVERHISPYEKRTIIDKDLCVI